MLLALLLGAEARAVTVMDAAGRMVEVGPAQRIVAIGGSVAETLVALGLEDRIAAIDLTASFPARLKAKPSVGYMRTLSPEGVLSLGPDLVLAIEGSGPPDAIEVLEAAGVPFVLVPEAKDAAGVIRKVRFIGEAVGAAEAGARVAGALAEDFAALDRALAGIDHPRRAIFVLGFSGGAPNAAGRDTAADAVMRLAHVENALADYRGYKRVVDESAAAAAPEAVITMPERGHELGPAEIFALPALAATPAARDRRLVEMSGTYLLGFGPRTAHAARDLAAAIYPERHVPELPARPWTVGGDPQP